MTTPTSRSALILLTLLLPLLAASAFTTYPTADDTQKPAEEAVFIQYLEIVTPDVKATCDALEKLHGVTFGDLVAELGNARTAALKDGGRLAVRAPMRPDEEPVVRPYVLVKDIAAAVESAEAAGGQIAMPPTEIPGEGRFAIYLQGGIQYGLWEL